MNDALLRLVGDWEATTSSCIVTVECDSGFRLDVEATGPGEPWTRVRRDEKAEAFDGTAEECGLERLRSRSTARRSPRRGSPPLPGAGAPAER
ncbi:MULTISPECIES: hypothetical protein [unclassified Streptomyces]|uniref:hypothetical protein n=1 Tax=unclassified Streptomyces TaxID=2593676 RepID=UPI000BACBF8B|nr:MULTISPECIES: hypothetical protein [unclassified Streptomyces]ASY37019.1 hypothetical protein CAC01_30750 [Streptomyces sp. CLI2509]MYX20416.1 hypothetical protein [Streptomyces sp. SID8380]